MKPLFFISAPVDTWSGYGARSRDIVKALIKSDKYDIKIIPQRWGSTPFGFLNADNPEHKQILDCVWNQPQLPRQPDVWMQITVPNEFQPIGKFNIGVTAGIETTICAPEWIDGLNRMDLTLVSSEHAKSVFTSAAFEQRDASQNNRVVRTIKLEKPIEVLFEGVDTNIYQKLDAVIESEIYQILESIEEDFLFEFTGHWLQGAIGQDRKDVGMLIKTFLETFKGKGKKPGLILKTSSATYSIMDREEILEKINQIRAHVGDSDLPNIYLLHGELTDEEINELYNHPKVKAHVTFTKGEGYGRPLLEASVSQKPVIAPAYSGHLDFLDKEMSVLLPGQLTQIHQSAVVQNMLIPESSWFTVDYKKASEILEDVFKNYKNYTEKAKRQSYRSRTEFSLDKMSEKLIELIDDKIPKPIQLKLPQLRKIELPKLKTIE
jgi:glycosyltransferase involved in cell wall biosynthesis